MKTRKNRKKWLKREWQRLQNVLKVKRYFKGKEFVNYNMEKESIIEKRLPLEVIERLGLTLTDRTLNDTFIHECVFYEVTDNVFITNYNITQEKPMQGGLWILFSRNKTGGNSMIVSPDGLSDMTREELNELVKGLGV